MRSALAFTVCTLLCAGCSALSTAGDMIVATASDIGSSISSGDLETAKGVGEGEEVPRDKREYQASIMRVLEQYGATIGSRNKFPYAWYASRAKTNGHALLTGALTRLYVKVSIDLRFFEIVAYDPECDTDGTQWVDKACANYYSHLDPETTTRYAVNGNYVLVFEEADDGNQPFIDKFLATSLK